MPSRGLSRHTERIFVEPDNFEAESGSLAAQDPDALKLYGRFVAELNDAEEEMKARNQSPARLSQGHLPYTQMMPSIDLSNLPAAAHGDPGSQVSDRGIPTSIAI